jgi:hypothetical protein
MWLLMLEAGVALFLLVFIVWWTLPSNKKPPASPHDSATQTEDDSKR